MERWERAAVTVRLIGALRANGSWCGETHLQKGIYLLQELLRVPVGLDFVLYKHGPYSFQLTAELVGLRAQLVIGLEAQPAPYGPRISLEDKSRLVLAEYGAATERYAQAIDFVAREMDGSGVAALERLATALYVTREMDGGQGVEERARLITELKPHVSLCDAAAAVEAADRMAERAEPLLVRA